MEIKELHRNYHSLTSKEREFKILLMSDLHWDNPKCDRETLKKHLDHAKAIGAKVILNGDTFCLMQGKYDPRSNKNDIRPEHNKANYLDVLIEDAVDWFGPYKDIITVVGYGNHETNIIKRLETDPLQRFVDLFNYTHKPEQRLVTGGYGGWINIRTETSSGNASKMLHYFHGSGGGGPVTKGTIQNQRKMADVEGADIIWMGHVHELYTMYQSKTYVNRSTEKPDIRNVLHVRTSTYKEEYGDGYMGWHIERGAPPKPIGSVLLTFSYRRINKKRKEGKPSETQFTIKPEVWTHETNL